MRRTEDMEFLRNWFVLPVRPRVLVLGNHKGGSGKSTTAMHLVAGLMNSGYSVGTVDLDSDQATLTHFVENRRRTASRGDWPLALPEHRLVEASSEPAREAAEAEEAARVAEAFADLIDRDYIVVDTPGSDSFLSRLGHVLADTLVTPLNDSFVDLDVLVRIDAEGQKIIGPSVYSIAVLDRWGMRMTAGGRPLDWVVTRTRLSHVYSRNHRELDKLLRGLAPTLGYRLAPGLGDRVVFREQFAQGLTVLDQPALPRWRFPGKGNGAARNEVLALMDSLGLGGAHQAARAAAARA